MPLLDLEAAGLSDWCDPATAAAADVASMQRLQQALVATMIAVMNERYDCPQPSGRRELEEQFREANAAGIVLATALKAEK